MHKVIKETQGNTCVPEKKSVKCPPIAPSSVNMVKQPTFPSPHEDSNPENSLSSVLVPDTNSANVTTPNSNVNNAATSTCTGVSDKGGVVSNAGKGLRKGRGRGRGRGRRRGQGRGGRGCKREAKKMQSDKSSDEVLCPVCNKDVDLAVWIQCDSCDTWYHRECTQIASEEEWENINQEGVTWSCHKF